MTRQAAATPASRGEGPLVRLERNVDSLPIWAPKTYADVLERTYALPWRGDGAAVRVLALEPYGQLRAFDKLVLTALVHLWNRQGRHPDGWASFRIAEVIELIQRSQRGGRAYRQVKASLRRLKFTGLQFTKSFYDTEAGALKSTRDTNILYELLIVEPRKLGRAAGDMPQMTRVQLNLAVVKNLLGNYTRPVSLRLLYRLSDRGVLFESYINGVLWRRPRVTKDVFALWRELGLSTRGYGYGSRVAAKMRDDLDKIAADPNSLLARYTFSTSRTRSRSKNLVLERKERAASMSTQQKVEQGRAFDDVDILVERIRSELRDESPNDANIRRIAERMPRPVIERGIFEAWGRYRDGLVENPAAYFVGIMKRRADELEIDLGL